MFVEFQKGIGRVEVGFFFERSLTMPWSFVVPPAAADLSDEEFDAAQRASISNVLKFCKWSSESRWPACDDGMEWWLSDIFETTRDIRIDRGMQKSPFRMASSFSALRPEIPAAEASRNLLICVSTLACCLHTRLCRLHVQSMLCTLGTCWFC